MLADGLELVANIWPIKDQRTMLIQRFAARAYVMDVRNEANVGDALKNLAQTDFYAAKQYPIPKRFILHSEHGKLKGCVLPSRFNQSLLNIIDPVLEELSSARPDWVGIDTASDKPRSVPTGIRFGDDPYLVITYLFEDAYGNLKPNTPDADGLP